MGSSAIRPTQALVLLAGLVGSNPASGGATIIFRDGFENFSTATPTFVAPFSRPTAPPDAPLPFRSRLDRVALYFGVDDTGSLVAALPALRTNWVASYVSLVCTSSGDRCVEDTDCSTGEVCTSMQFCAADPAPAPGCIAELYSGAATWSELNTFRNRIGVQISPNATANAFPASPSTGLNEAPFQPPSCVADPVSCPAAPLLNCVAGGVGCPGFRADAVRLYVQITDADQQCSGTACPNYTAFSAGVRLAQAGLRFLGVAGSDDGGGIGTPLSVAQDIALASGSVDRLNNPLAESATDAAVLTSTVSLVRRALFDSRTTATIVLVDLPGDDGDALQFIQSFETFQPGTPECPAVGPASDAQPPGGDGLADTYDDVLLGTRLCWRLNAVASNTTVTAAGGSLFFHGRATLRVNGYDVQRREFSVQVPP